MPTPQDSTRDKIIKLLRIEPRLTVNQLAALDPAPRRKEALKAFFPKKSDPDLKYHETYQRTYSALKTMLKHGLVARGRDHTDEPHLYWLTETNYKWMKGELNRGHEMQCARLCVAYAPFWIHWDNGWTAYEREGLNIERYRFDYDRRMVFGPGVLPDGREQVPFVWEVDGASEPIYKESRRDVLSERKWLKSINGKVDKYLQFAKENPATWFYVLFATYAGHLGSAGKRANELQQYLSHRGLTRGQFLVTTVDRACADPLGQIWHKPGDMERLYSLRDL